jgi:hypothetical protein
MGVRTLPLAIKQFGERVIQSVESRKLLIKEIPYVEVILERCIVFPATQAERLKHTWNKLANKRVDAEFELACLRSRVGRISLRYTVVC